MTMKRKHKLRWTLMLYDTAIYLFSAILVLVLYPSSIDHLTPPQITMHAALGLVCVMAARLFTKAYERIWRYAGPKEYIWLMVSDAIASAAYLLLRSLLPRNITFIRSLSMFTLNLLGCIIIRLLYQFVYQNRMKHTRLEKFFLVLLKAFTGSVFADEAPASNKIKIAIVGAGSVGAMLADELIQNPKATYQPVCFVDIDREKVGREIYGVPVLASEQGLSNKLSHLQVQEVVFALPNVTTERRKELYTLYKGIQLVKLFFFL